MTERAAHFTSETDESSEKVSDHKIRYAARAEIANACNVDETLHETTRSQQSKLKWTFMCAFTDLLSQSILSRGPNELYVLVEAFDR